MKKTLLLFIILIISVCAYCDDKPMCLIYPPELLKGATEDDSVLVINTLKSYLNKSDKLESLLYTIEMPSLLLAIKDGKIISEESALNNSIDCKIKVASALGYDYLFLPELTRNEDTFEINFIIYDIKNNDAQNYGAVTRTNAKKFAADINSAVSGIVVQIIRYIFNENADFSAKEEKEEKIKQEETVDFNELKPKELISLGDKEVKNENYPQAIFYYKKAIDKSPDNPEYRLKLAEAYYSKQLYKEALDQFYNAINLGYRDENLYELKEKYENRVRAEEYVLPISEMNKNEEDEEIILAPPQIENKAAEYNKQIENALKKADADWKAKKNLEAIKAYTDIIKKFPKDYRAYERMVLLYANSMQFSKAAQVIKIMQGRKVDYNKDIAEQRINTLSAIIGAYYLKIINDLSASKDNILANEGNTEIVTNLRIQEDKNYEVAELLNVLSNQSQSFHLTNMKLTGNLINEAIGGYVDYLEAGDFDGITTAESLLEQANLRISKIKY